MVNVLRILDIVAIVVSPITVMILTRMITRRDQASKIRVDELKDLQKMVLENTEHINVRLLDLETSSKVHDKTLQIILNLLGIRENKNNG